MSLLVAVNENSEVTKMGSSNLGIVFGPTLMKVNETDINACQQAGKAIEFIIEHHHLFFKINRRGSTQNPFVTKSNIVPSISLEMYDVDKQENSKSEDSKEKKRLDSKDKIDSKNAETTIKEKKN